MLEKYLQEIGLNEKESAVYLVLLKVDDASVADLADKTKIKRPTVYVVLETLAKKGLVSQVDIGNKTHYAAQPPEHLETYVQQQKLKFEQTAERLKDIVPQLKAVQRELGERPIVKLFDGRESALNNSIDFFGLTKTTQASDKRAYSLTNIDLVEDIFTSKEIDFVRNIRPSKNVPVETLYVSERKDLPSTEISNRKKIDPTKYPISCEVAIYEDRVLFITLGKKVSSIFIQSKDVADTLSSLFRMAFENYQDNKKGRE